MNSMNSSNPNNSTNPNNLSPVKSKGNLTGATNSTNPTNPKNLSSVKSEGNLTGAINSKNIFFLLLFILAVFAIILFWLKSENSSGFKENLEDRIRKELISIDQIHFQTKVDAIYILGGSPRSLISKFKKAANLYNDGICKRILILSEPGITEYSSKLGRNLTNNEWAILKLEQLGVPKKNIEPITIGKGFFGTLTEAKYTSQLMKKRDYENLILITTPYHTKRTKICFENFLNGHNVVFYVQGSEERVTLNVLIIELIKLKIYKYFLIS